jgi:hypothetical protein
MPNSQAWTKRRAKRFCILLGLELFFWVGLGFCLLLLLHHLLFRLFLILLLGGPGADARRLAHQLLLAEGGKAIFTRSRIFHQ